MILSIETATHICSVALHSTEGNLITLIESHQERKHAEVVTLLVEAALQTAQVAFSSLSAIAVGAGPGSYTGLRIGASVAKGLCVGLGLPLITVSSLQAWAASMTDFCVADEWLCPLMDARRMEVFTAIFDKNLAYIEKDTAKVLDGNSFADYLAQNKIIFFGDGVEKARSVITHEQALFIPNRLPSAREIGTLAVQKFHQQTFDDVAYFEPNYGKEFYTTAKKIHSTHD